MMRVTSIPVSEIGRKARTASAAMPAMRLPRLDVFLKVAERCNIACSYCYFFYGGDDSFERHPVYIAQTTIEEVAAFLAKTARDSAVEEMQINFHGGEPLMLKKDRFELMCATLCNALESVPRMTLGIQTNAMLIDDEWIAIIGKFNISVGVSLDGPREYNDEFRVDHQGRGTYDRTVAGMRKLDEALADGRLILRYGLICVADPKRDAKRTFNHFVDELGQTDINIGFPMVTHDTVDEQVARATGKYMCDMFDAWVERNDRRIRVGFISTLLGSLIGGADDLARSVRTRARGSAFTISSNGELGGQDDERIASYAFSTGFMATGEVGLSDFYSTPNMVRYLEARKQIGERCQSCCWKNVCGGGGALGSNVQRYSKANGFANHSVYCEALSQLLTRLSEYAVSRGVPFEKIAEVLFDDDAITAT